MHVLLFLPFIFLTMHQVYSANPVNTPTERPAVQPEPLEFVIIIPSYNNGGDKGKWVKRNLHSIAQQKVKAPFRVYCVNDCSTDNTGALMDEAVKEHKLASKVKVIHNQKRVGALANIYTTIHEYCKGHEVVVLLDGDDAFIPGITLTRLEAEYKDPYVWSTYGSFVYYPSGDRGFSQALPQEVWRTRSFRKHDFAFQHLRTFKAALFKKIDPQHLKDAQGNFFPMAWDLAIMIPIAEMCTPEDPTKQPHMRYIPDILYIYNCDNPLSDFRTNRPLQIQLDNYIRSLPQYKPVDNL